jgi:hypothetical protein
MIELIFMIVTLSDTFNKGADPVFQGRPDMGIDS